MAIEGPLRELGIHDVFQLLDLSRKTGRLRVTSALRDNEGTVDFRQGRVTGASIRSNPHPIGQILLHAGKITEAELDQACTQQRDGDPRRLGDILVANGALTERELARQVRRQIEAVVFELMSWQEGFFSFTEGDSAPAPADAGLSTESLLMEAARRIDEWARIADRIPNLSVVPALADTDGEHPPMLDLHPNEWQVLAAVDGATDLRHIAGMVGVSDFDVARIVYGLLATGVVSLRPLPAVVPDTPDDAVMLLSDAREALRTGRHEDALAATERALDVGGDQADTHAIAAQALIALGRFDVAASQLRDALRSHPDSTTLLMLAARVALRQGEWAQAIDLWQIVIGIDPSSDHAEQAREALAHATRLSTLVEVADER
jgi:tetratricopeptide (TPR) repeat protein